MSTAIPNRIVPYPAAAKLMHDMVNDRKIGDNDTKTFGYQDADAFENAYKNDAAFKAEFDQRSGFREGMGLAALGYIKLDIPAASERSWLGAKIERAKMAFSKMFESW